MFTGIVQATAQVTCLEKTPLLMRYALQFPEALLENLHIGASVSVHGICQTVVSIRGNEVTFEAIDETLKRTTLNTLVPWRFVNIERSAKIGDEIGGHLLSGHIIGMGNIQHIEKVSGNQFILTISCPPEWMKYIFPKGYIALNGASLTLVDVNLEEKWFTVHLIPETLRSTTFYLAKVQEKINIEIDSQTQTIVDTVERVLKEQGQRQ